MTKNILITIVSIKCLDVCLDILGLKSSNYMRKMEKNKEQYEKYVQEKKDKAKKKKTEREE